MSNSSVTISFRIAGPLIDPDLITKSSGVQPKISWLAGTKGQAPQPRFTHSWWVWESPRADYDDELWQLVVKTLTPAIKDIQAALRSDPEAYVTTSVVGSYDYDLIETVEQAIAHDYGDEKDVVDALPFLDGSVIGVELSREVITFLSDMQSTFDVHINAGLDDKANGSSTVI